MSSQFASLLCHQTLTRTILQASCFRSSSPLHRARNLYCCPPNRSTLNKDCVKKQSKLNLHKKAESTDSNTNKPLSYTKSKASNWTVGHSFGHHNKQNSVWRGIALSSVMLALLAWTFTREETEIDERLGRDLFQQLEAIYPKFKAPPRNDDI